MPRRIHFLNVKNGACSIIQHGSGSVSVFDVSCGVAAPVVNRSVQLSLYESREWEPVSGNYHQKYKHDNPIEYLQKIGVQSIFRFILTHPDMDHLDGIKALFQAFPVGNFWDTANTKEFPAGAFDARPRLAADWQFYKTLRDTKPDEDPKRLVLYSGDKRDQYRKEGLSILAPTPTLMALANKRKNWNDASYVVMYRTNNPARKILFTGDSEDETWEHILENWEDEVSNVDILIAPHHGRDSGRDYEFLDVVNPRLTLFGNALSEHHAHQPWYDRELPILTNNQAGYVILDVDQDGINVYGKNEKYARNLTKQNGWDTFESEELDAWYLGAI